MEEKRKPTNYLPLEIVVKMLVRERDWYKERLSRVVHYAHLMEDKVKRMHQDNEKMQAQYDKMKAEYDEVVKKGVTRSEEYKHLQAKIKEYKRDKNTLLSIIATLRNDVQNEK